MSMPISCMTSMARGFTPLGVMPALNTSRRSFARWRRYPSAIWLRAELPVQRNRTFGFIAREHPTTSLGLATVEFDRSHGLGRDPLKFPSVGREISGGNGIRQLRAVSNVGDGDICENRFEGDAHIIVKQFSAGDTPDVCAYVPADVFGECSQQHDVADCEVSSRFEDAKHFTKYGRLVRAEVDDAVRDNEIDGIIVNGNVFDLTLTELNVSRAEFCRVFAGAREHVIRHVNADDMTGRANLIPSKECVETCAASEIKHRHTELNLRQGKRIAATETKISFSG